MNDEKYKKGYCGTLPDVELTPDSEPLHSVSHYSCLSFFGKIRYWIGITRLMITGYYDDGRDTRHWFNRNCKLK